MGQDPLQHGHTNLAERILRAAAAADLSARQRVPDMAWAESGSRTSGAASHPAFINGSDFDTHRYWQSSNPSTSEHRVNTAAPTVTGGNVVLSCGVPTCRVGLPRTPSPVRTAPGS
jgi:hypothetical protein